MQTRTVGMLIAAALALGACSGGGGPGSATGAGGGVAQPPTDGSGGSTGAARTTPGVWQGTVTSPTTGTAAMVGLTTATGQSVWMTTDGRAWTGELPATGNAMHAVMNGYMYPGRQFPDGSNTGPWSMTGSHANGTWTGRFHGSGDDATFGFSMHPAYGRPASLETLAGTYTRTTSIGYTMTWSFTQGGQLTGSDSRGCVFEGTVSVPDPARNLYRIDAAVSACGVLDGAYHGHGTLVDADAMQDWMGSMGCFQYGSGGWSGGGMMGGGTMGGGMMGGGPGRWWPYAGANTVTRGTGNLFMFAMTDGRHAIMDALTR